MGNVKTRVTRLFAFAAVPLVSIASTHCLPDLSPLAVPGVGQEGSCMCATCWNRPFCGSSDGSVFTARASESDPCPLGTIASTAAKRATHADQQEGGFHCIAPDNHDVASPTAACPADPASRQRLQYADRCRDVPVCARIGSNYDDCTTAKPAPGEPTCPQLTAGASLVQTACGSQKDVSLEAAIDSAVVKIANACAVHGTTIPAGDAPSRFCYLSCVDTSVCSPSSCNSQCDPNLFDPPVLADSSLVVDLVPEDSVAIVIVTADGEISKASVHLNGTLAVDVPRSCVGPLGDIIASCEAAIPFLSIRSSDVVRISEVELSGLKVQAPVPLRGSATTIDDASILTFPPSESLYVSGNLKIDDENKGLRAQQYQSPSGYVSGIDWTKRSFGLSTVLTSPDGKQQLVLGLSGRIRNLPPLANAGADKTIECTAAAGSPATLSASGSTDPDGPTDIGSFSWSIVDPNGRATTASGKDITVSLPLGTSQASVTVTDRSGLSDVASVALNVLDTTPPTISSASIKPGCLYPPNHKMHLFRLGTEIQAQVADTCSTTLPSLKITNVTSNQPSDATGDGSTANDIRFGSGAVCVRSERRGNDKTPRTYNITLEAVDAQGNKSSTVVTILVPHDQSPDERCKDTSVAPDVADDDPACLASAVSTTTPVVKALAPGGAPTDSHASKNEKPIASKNSSCSFAGGVSTGCGSGLLVTVGTLLLAIRRKRSRSKGLVLAMAASMFAVGCGSSEPDTQKVKPTPTQVQQQATGVWLNADHACACPTMAVLRTAECDAADCVESDALVLRADQKSFNAVVRRSVTAKTFSAVGGAPGVTSGTWNVTDKLELRQQFARSELTTKVECDGQTLTRPGVVKYSRAPESLANAMLGVSQSGQWNAVVFGP